MIGKKKKKDMEKDQEDLQNAQGGTDEVKAETEKPQVEPKDEAKAPAEDGEKTNVETEDPSAKIAELNDKYLRLYAEFDNYRRRTQRERVELIQSASSELIITLLPVLDDFDRALKAFDQTNEVDALKEGLVLVHQKFRGTLTQKGLEEMKTIGEHFNTDLHEAVANIPADKEENKEKVVDEIQKGYLLNGKVIRFAKVVVAN